MVPIKFCRFSPRSSVRFPPFLAHPFAGHSFLAQPTILAIYGGCHLKLSTGKRCFASYTTTAFLPRLLLTIICILVAAICPTIGGFGTVSPCDACQQNLDI
uniref:Uncharacterized protein n=1 Tax=Globodera rostochiensis TaxID=31243 RepID=A0A914I451_GLORO